MISFTTGKKAAESKLIDKELEHTMSSGGEAKKGRTRKTIHLHFDFQKDRSDESEKYV